MKKEKGKTALAIFGTILGLGIAFCLTVLIWGSITGQSFTNVITGWF